MRRISRHKWFLPLAYLRYRFVWPARNGTDEPFFKTETSAVAFVFGAPFELVGWFNDEEIVLLLMVYAKAVQGNVKPKDIKRG